MVPFDPETQELAFDVKGLCGLPHNATNRGVRSLRGIVLPKGKYTHVPKLAGKYFVLGKFSLRHVLCKVHFKPALKRDPELLTSFIDLGATDDLSEDGIMVESYLMPLKISQSVYQSQPRETQIEDVAGFSKLSSSEAKDLEAFLKRIDSFVLNGIAGEDSQLTFIAKPVADRLKQLHDYAIAKLDAELAHNEKQRLPAARDEYFDKLSKLNTLISTIVEMPAVNYDAPINARIQCMEVLNPPDHEEQAAPEWLTSPLRKELAEGKAVGNATRLIQPNSAQRPLRESQWSPVLRSASKGGQAGPSSGVVPTEKEWSEEEEEEEEEEVEGGGGGHLLGDSDDDEDEGEEEEEESAAAPAAVGAKRSRKQVQPFVPAPSKAGRTKASAKAVASKAKPPAVSKAKGGPKPKRAPRALPGASADAPFGISPASGKPYIRPCGAYQRKLGSMVAAAAARAAAPVASSTDESSELTRLRTENEQLKAKIEFLSGSNADAVKMGVLTTKAEMSQQLLEQFQAGLERGLAMVSGHGLRFTPPSSAGAGWSL